MSEIIKIKQMIEDGFAIRKIANLLNLLEQDVKQCVIENCFHLKQEKFSENDMKKICNLYISGVSAKQLGIKFSIDKRRVQKWVKEKSHLRNKNDSHRIINFNQNIFDTIDTPEKAYWLGFFYADAYNNVKYNSFTLALQRKDCSHIIKLANFVSIDTNQVLDCHHSRKHPASQLTLYSKHFCNALDKAGCHQAKSFIIKYPEWLDSKLNSHFIRGMFDGDGCITFRKKQREWKWSLVSTQEGCNAIQKIIFDNIGINVNYHCISKTGKNTYELESSGNQKINKIMNWLYTDYNKDIILERKYEKFQKLIEQQNNRKINREEYFISDDIRNSVLKDFSNNISLKEISISYKISLKSVKTIIAKIEKGPHCAGLLF